MLGGNGGTTVGSSRWIFYFFIGAWWGIVNSRPMVWQNTLMVLLVVASVGIGRAQSVDFPEKKEVVEKVPFTLDQVIAPVLKNMAVPVNRLKIDGVKMAISSPSEKAQAHVKQGFALVHAQWDFEAYRHFCVALQEDPDCLMAYCGVALALAKPHNEYVTYRRAAVGRMLDLLEADKKVELDGGVPRFPSVEKEFAAAVATLVSTSPRAAGALFHRIGTEYPNFLQAQLLALFLSRGGYDVMGDPTPGQTLVVKRAREFLKKHPENPMVIGFWLSLNAEAPNSSINLKNELLPYAQKLVEMNSEMPSWQYVLGHYAWRVGDYELAAKSFRASADLYAKWMKDEGVSMNDCEGYIKAKCYLANTLYQNGDFEEAMKVAQELRGEKLDVARPRSNGNAILMWRAYNLSARLYAARGAKGDVEKALKSLPGKKELSAFANHAKYPTLAGVYTDALSIYMGCRKAIGAKNLKDASILHRVIFRKHITALAQVSKGATQVADYSHYLRAGNSLSIYDMELAGLIAMRGPKNTQIVAIGRFLAARDKQHIPSMMMPPITLSPMENRMGEYYLGAGKVKEALDAYTAGVQRYVENAASMKGMDRCRELLKKGE